MIKDWLTPKIVAAKADPRSTFVMIMGDLNSYEKHAWGFSIREAARTKLSSSALHHPKFWAEAVSELLEVDPGDYNHYDAGSEKLSRLTRCFVSAPTWLAQHLEIEARSPDPVCLFEKGISDHSPLLVSIGRVGGTNSPAFKIPSFITKSAAYKNIVKELLSVGELETFPPLQRLERHKDIIRQAARFAREELFKNPASDETRLQLYGSIASCVAFNKIGTARHILKMNCEAAEFMTIQGSRVLLVSPPNFSSKFCQLKSQYYKSRQLQIELPNNNIASCGLRRTEVRIYNNNVNNTKRNKTHRAVLYRLARLWKESDRVYSLQGVLKGRHLVARSGHEKAEALGSYWGEIFGKTEAVEGRLDNILKFAKSYVTPWDFSEVSPPGPQDYDKLLRRLEDSAAGPDGLPYSAWHDPAGMGADTMCMVGLELARGILPPIGFNASISAFLAKGESSSDTLEVVREAADTRPLSMKNTDNKLVAGAFNLKIKTFTASKLHRHQQGFVVGGQGSTNVCEIDTASRVLALKSNWAIAALLDIGQAFPSMLHDWLRVILVWRGFPIGFVRVFSALYHLCIALFSQDGALYFLFFVFNGVLQGCPLSGSLFAIGADPIVHACSRMDITHTSTTRWFADDCAAVFDHPRGLLAILGIFERISPLCGLVLKHKKFQVVALGRQPEEMIPLISQWIDEHIPCWRGVKVTGAGKYLGTWVGPWAGKYFFKDAIAKWEHRAQLIAAAGTSALVTLRAYNIHAISVLSYLCQFHPLPPEAFAKEQPILSKLLKIPHMSWGSGGPFALAEMGLESAISLRATSLANLARASATTIKWKQSADVYRQACIAGGSIHDIHQNLQLPWFDTPCIALNLEACSSACSWRSLVPAPPGSPPPPWPPFQLQTNFNFRKQGVLICSAPILPVTDDTFEVWRRLEAASQMEKPQKHFYSIFFELWHGPAAFSWPQLIRARLEKYNSRHKLGIEHTILTFPWEKLVTAFGLLKAFQVVHVIRTLTNGWMTSSRMPQGCHVRCCLFGCDRQDGKDQLAHYAQCRVLWAFVSAACRVDVSNGVGARLGLTLDKRTLGAVALASHIYHSLRKHHFQNSNELHKSMRDATKVFCVQARRPFFAFSSQAYVWQPELFKKDFWVDPARRQGLDGTHKHDRACNSDYVFACGCCGICSCGCPVSGVDGIRVEITNYVPGSAIPESSISECPASQSDSMPLGCENVEDRARDIGHLFACGCCGICSCGCPGSGVDNFENETFHDEPSPEKCEFSLRDCMPLGQEI